MFNNSLRGAVGAGVISSLLVLTGCGTSSASATDQARKKTPVNNPSSTPTTTTTTTTTTATTTLVASASNPLTGQSPGVGAPDIATTDHDVNNDLVTMALPAASAPGDPGAFRFICHHTTLATDDPTVYYQQPGKSHLHDETGVHGWNASSNYVNLRQSGGGSECNDVAGFDQNQAEASWAANRTPYWQPALLDGKGNAILVDFIVVYYKRKSSSDPTVSDPTNPQYLGKAVPLPNGIKFIFGADPMNSSATPSTPFTYHCTSGAAGAVYEANVSFAEAINCAKAHSDGTLEVRIDAPACWDGVNLDTADHRSHLAPASYGTWGYQKCDSGHPYVIPTYTYAAYYTILPTDTGDIHWASDEMDNSKPRGWSFHVDYGPAAWDPTVLAMWTNNCIEKLLSCNSGNLGNGLGLKGAAQPVYYNSSTNTYTQSWRNPNRLVPIPPPPSS